MYAEAEEEIPSSSQQTFLFQHCCYCVVRRTLLFAFTSREIELLVCAMLPHRCLAFVIT